MQYCTNIIEIITLLTVVVAECCIGMLWRGRHGVGVVGAENPWALWGGFGGGMSDFIHALAIVGIAFLVRRCLDQRNR
jgi:hypothetical protein